jgi:hypothetical protein
MTIAFLGVIKESNKKILDLAFCEMREIEPLKVHIPAHKLPRSCHMTVHKHNLQPYRLSLARKP